MKALILAIALSLSCFVVAPHTASAMIGESIPGGGIITGEQQVVTGGVSQSYFTVTWPDGTISYIGPF